MRFGVRISEKIKVDYLLAMVAAHGNTAYLFVGSLVNGEKILAFYKIVEVQQKITIKIRKFK